MVRKGKQNVKKHYYNMVDFRLYMACIPLRENSATSKII